MTPKILFIVFPPYENIDCALLATPRQGRMSALGQSRLRWPSRNSGDVRCAEAEVKSAGTWIYAALLASIRRCKGPRDKERADARTCHGPDRQQPRQRPSGVR